MSKAETGINGLAGDAMVDDGHRRECLSALADGRLEGEELAATLAFAAETGEGRATWALYHLVGDALRSADLAQPANPAFMSRLRNRLAQEAPPARPQNPVQLGVLAPALSSAANAAVFRWKVLAGCASLAAAVAIGWAALVSWQGAGASGGARLALVPGRAASVQEEPTVVQADSQGQQLMVRDPRLDELLAAHKQFGSMSALQMPADFLRNATFETSGH
ncbi:sigma-E factor negative regulatory protein [Verminephrobacter aporrectodeae]|uniref:sigma-E factor negative regulatory protein n=1 Tax=Verminephrobacter aporrectodeae TaxID=1110389 RepID=UPI00223739D5|nr:sigma-E factor negative regulatory protein [Verminephrobacter aporrectodeae]